MKVTLKVLVGVVLCTGLVQVISPKAKMSVTVVKEDPSMVLQYAITAEKKGKNEKLDGKESRRSYKKFNGRETKISFDEYHNAKLYIKKSGASDDEAKSLSLRNRAQGLDPEDVIVINGAGVPRYRSKSSVAGFQEAIQPMAN